MAIQGDLGSPHFGHAVNKFFPGEFALRLRLELPGEQEDEAAAGIQLQLLQHPDHAVRVDLVRLARILEPVICGFQFPLVDGGSCLFVVGFGVGEVGVQCLVQFPIGLGQAKDGRLLPSLRQLNKLPNSVLLATL